MPRGKNKAKAKTPVTSPITPYGGKPVINQGLRETEITYKSICDTIIRGVSSRKHYLHFLPDKRNIDGTIKLENRETGAVNEQKARKGILI